jgi:L-lysine 2,3-aminomutase
VPHPVPEPATRSHSQHSFRVFTAADLDQLTARAGLAPARRRKIRAAAAVTGFRVTSYVTDELIDWSVAPDDPVYRLYFPDEDILAGTGTGGLTAGRPAAGGPDRPRTRDAR